MATSGDKLWRYSGVARVWAWSLIGVALALMALAAALQAGGEDGLGGSWLAAALGVAAGTGLIGIPVLRFWLGRGSLPSVRLPDAVRVSGRSRPREASPRDWRRWTITSAVLLFLGTAAMLLFLIAILGGGGVAEGVTAGVLAAWGAVTLEDVRRIRRAEDAEGRRYYAACRRPTGAGNHLVWLRTSDT